MHRCNTCIYTYIHVHVRIRICRYTYTYIPRSKVPTIPYLVMQYISKGHQPRNAHAPGTESPRFAALRPNRQRVIRYLGSVFPACFFVRDSLEGLFRGEAWSAFFLGSRPLVLFVGLEGGRCGGAWRCAVVCGMRVGAASSVGKGGGKVWLWEIMEEREGVGDGGFYL